MLRDNIISGIRLTTITTSTTWYWNGSRLLHRCHPHLYLRS